jgi:hypothetical protein
MLSNAEIDPNEFKIVLPEYTQILRYTKIPYFDHSDANQLDLTTENAIAFLEVENIPKVIHELVKFAMEFNKSYNFLISHSDLLDKSI